MEVIIVEATTMELATTEVESNNSSNLSGNGTTSGESGTKGNSISTSTALTTLPKTGTKLGALYAIIASGISAVFAWFKSKKIK